MSMFDWAGGTVEEAAALLAQRAAASRMLGGAVRPDETPPWAEELLKQAQAPAPPVPAAPPAPAAPTPEPAAPAAPAAPTPEPAPASPTPPQPGFMDWLKARYNAASKAVQDDPFLQRTLTGATVGAGLGGLAGMTGNLLSSNKRKRPLSNALFGAGLGGLTGGLVGGAVHVGLTPGHIKPEELKDRADRVQRLESQTRQNVRGSGVSGLGDAVLGRGDPLEAGLRGAGIGAGLGVAGDAGVRGIAAGTRYGLSGLFPHGPDRMSNAELRSLISQAGYGNKVLTDAEILRLTTNKDEAARVLQELSSRANPAPPAAVPNKPPPTAPANPFRGNYKPWLASKDPLAAMKHVYTKNKGIAPLLGYPVGKSMWGSGLAGAAIGGAGGVAHSVGNTNMPDYQTWRDDMAKTLGEMAADPTMKTQPETIRQELQKLLEEVRVSTDPGQLRSYQERARKFLAGYGGGKKE